MASTSPSRQWAQLANCVHFVTCGVCGTSSSALQDAALAEPLLQNPRQHPAASSEAPSPSVLTAARQQPALPARTSTPVSKPPPEVASAAGSGFDTTSGSDDASGAHATRAPAQAHTSNLALPAEQKSKGGQDMCGVGVTDSALQVPTFLKLESTQPAQAHDLNSQAPPGAKPVQPASTDHNHDQHAALTASGQQPDSKGSAEHPAVAEESSNTSADQAKAAADKKPAEASSVAAAGASRDSESLRQPEATTATQVGAASQERHGAAAAWESSPSGAAAKAVQSKAQVKSLAKEVLPPGSAATQQSPVRPSTEEAPAAEDSLASKGVAAKQSEIRSVAEDERSVAADTAAKQSPDKSSAGGTSVADEHSAAKAATAKQSPVRLSAAGTSLPAKDPAAKQSPVEPPVVEASEAHQQSAAAGTAAKKDTAAEAAAKANSAAGEGSLAIGPAAKHSKGEAPSAADSSHEAVTKSLQSVVQSTSKLNQGQQPSADGANAVAAHESPSAKGGPTETASSHVRGTKAKAQSAGRKLDEQEEANKAQPKKVHSAEDAVPSIASAKESQRASPSVGEGRPETSTTEPQAQDKLGALQEPSKGVGNNTASSSSQHGQARVSTMSEPEEKLSQTKDVKSLSSAQHSSSGTGDDTSCAATGHVSNSLSLNGQPGIASTAVQGTSSRGRDDSVASALGGAQEVSRDQEGGGSAKEQHAVAAQAGNGPDAPGTARQSDTAKTEGEGADSGHDGAAQMIETGSARKDTAAVDAGAGKKKNKGKKKKKGK